jgi:hypothetical protein
LTDSRTHCTESEAARFTAKSPYGYSKVASLCEHIIDQA